MARAERAPVLVDLRRERAGSGIARVIAGWRRQALADPDPVALLEARQMSDASPRPTEPRQLRTLMRAAGADVLHTVYPYTLVPAGVRNVLTVFDTLLLDRDPARATVARTLLRRNARHATRIVTTSAHARDDIVARLGFDPALMDVVHIAVDPADPGTPDLDRPYALYVGNAKPHKHVDELLAWAPHALRPQGLRLVAVVPPADKERLAAAYPTADLRSGVSENELDALLAGATLYVSLAEGEGFGLPPLEAAARGVPAVLHDAGAHREVMGASGTYCALDADDLAAKVGDALDARASLSARATARAAELSWAASWQALKQVHQRARDAPPRS